MSKIERQRQIDSDSVRDGCVRWCQNTEYLEAADTKPYRNLIGISWRSLADAIRAAQDSLKTSKKAKLPAWGLPLLSLGHEQLALITLGTLFKGIVRKGRNPSVERFGEMRHVSGEVTGGVHSRSRG